MVITRDFESGLGELPVIDVGVLHHAAAEGEHVDVDVGVSSRLWTFPPEPDGTATACGSHAGNDHHGEFARQCLDTTLKAEMRGLMEQTRATCLFVSRDLEDLHSVLFIQGTEFL